MSESRKTIISVAYLWRADVLRILSGLISGVLVVKYLPSEEFLSLFKIQVTFGIFAGAVIYGFDRPSIKLLHDQGERGLRKILQFRFAISQILMIFFLMFMSAAEEVTVPTIIFMINFFIIPLQIGKIKLINDRRYNEYSKAMMILSLFQLVSIWAAVKLYPNTLTMACLGVMDNILVLTLMNNYAKISLNAVYRDLQTIKLLKKRTYTTFHYYTYLSVFFETLASAIIVRFMLYLPFTEIKKEAVAVCIRFIEAIMNITQNIFVVFYVGRVNKNEKSKIDYRLKFLLLLISTTLLAAFLDAHSTIIMGVLYSTNGKNAADLSGVVCYSLPFLISMKYLSDYAFSTGNEQVTLAMNASLIISIVLYVFFARQIELDPTEFKKHWLIYIAPIVAFDAFLRGRIKK